MNKPLRIFFSTAAILFLLPFSPSMRAQNDSDARTAPSPATPATAAATAPAAAAIAAAGKTYELDVPATTMWLDTKIDLLAGAQIQFTATGTASYPSTDSKGQSRVQTFSPDGLARGWRDLVHQYPVANSGHGALIGRIGSGDGAQPFAINQSQKSAIPVPGRLFLGLNQGTREAATAQGSFHVTIAVLSAGSGELNASFLPDTPVSNVTTDLLGKIPRRVKDPSGNPGDMVNVLLIGAQDDVTAAFKAAGWVQVDRTVTDTILTGALAT